MEKPYITLSCDTLNGNAVLPLQAFLKSAGALFQQFSTGIDVDNYLQGNFIVGYDLTNSQLPPGESFEMPISKSIDLIWKLNRPTNGITTMIPWSEIVRVDENDHYYYWWLSNEGGYAMPKRADPQAREFWEELLARQP